MANLNSVPKFQARLPKTGFDVGRDIYFTSSIGMMLPIYHDVLNQGESIQFKIDMNTILQPLKRPVQMHLRQKVDLFFVPMQMLCTWFGQQFYQTNDFLTSYVSGSRGSSLPILPFKDYFADNYSQLSDLNTGVYNPSFHGFDTPAKGTYRLLMHLGYNANCLFSGIENGGIKLPNFHTYQPNVFPAPLLAYQAIYHNYYRLDDRFSRVVKDYNFDYFDNDYNNLQPSTFELRYHARIKDYFTSLKVSPVYSSLNLANEPNSSYLLNKVNNYLDGYETRLGDNHNNADVSLQNIPNKDFTEFTTQAGIRISTGIIRSLFAVEKLNRILGRARKDYDSQTLAHLGFKVPRDVKHEITFIGSVDGGIGVKTIESLANTVSGDNGAELGERAGSGSGALHSQHPLKFTAPCHGVLMAIYYAVPETSYTLGATMEKINSLTNRLDFYQPEYDKLGMQPMFFYESAHFNPQEQFASDPEVFPSSGYALPLGWQYRYEQYKRKYDVHSIAFYRPVKSTEFVNSWSPWVLGSQPFSHYFVDWDTSESVDEITPYNLSFLVAPTYLDDIFVQSYNRWFGYNVNGQFDDNDIKNFVQNPWLLFQTDPFMHAARIDCLKVSTMSTYGEPELD